MKNNIANFLDLPGFGMPVGVVESEEQIEPTDQESNCSLETSAPTRNITAPPQNTTHNETERRSCDWGNWTAPESRLICSQCGCGSRAVGQVHRRNGSRAVRRCWNVSCGNEWTVPVR